MGYAERSYSYRPGDGSRGFGGGGLGGTFGSVSPWVLKLLIANAAVWLLMFVGLLPRRWSVEVLGFSPGGFLVHPWSPVTYMFVHGGFWHLFVNMLVLFFFGPPLERAWGGRDFLKFYLVAGLGGALASVAFLPTALVDAGTPMVGASAAVFGLLLAFALRWPEAKIYIWGILPIRAKWFMAILVGFTFLSISGGLFGDGGGTTAHWAHLGGLVTGFLYLRWGEGLSRSLDDAADRMIGLFAADEGQASRGRTRARRPGGRGSRTRERSEERGREIPFPGGNGQESSEEMLDEVDRILDKIREEGLESLSEEERSFLDEMSRRYRG